MLKNRKFVVLSLLLVLVYVGTYAVLSRRGYAEADEYRVKGFYYFSPEESIGWRLGNNSCVCLFHPINKVDQWLAVGREPAAEPMWRLGGSQK